MVVWGGYGDSYRSTGGRYALGQGIDGDGDGFTLCTGDCDDTQWSVHPGAAEVCNGLDDNCAGGADEGFDLDADGFTGCGGDDCDDANRWSGFPPRRSQTSGSPWRAPRSLLGQPGDARGNETRYDLVSGDLASAPGIDFSTASCLQSAGGNSASDPRPDPVPGQASGTSPGSQLLRRGYLRRCLQGCRDPVVSLVSAGHSEECELGSVLTKGRIPGSGGGFSVQ